MPANPAPPEPSERRIVSLDARQLRVLAHPLRWRILGSLRADGPATASILGDRLGESSGQTSYHLRQLAKVGLVAELPELGNRRDRWWDASHDITSWSPGDFLDDPDAAASADWMLGEIARVYTDRVAQWIGRRQQAPAEWIAAADMSDLAFRLTPDGLADLNRRLLEVVYEAMEHEAAPDDPSAETCVVLLQSFPDPSAFSSGTDDD
jgi:DNA-binding transcriptional ArsR family regulator